MIKQTFLLLFLYLSNVIAYDLPEVNLTNNTQKPEVILFSAESIVKDKQALYRLKWKTINATDVIMTYIGKVKTSGTIDITKDEYNRGAITLTATKQGSSVSDSKTINKQNGVPQEPPVIFQRRENKGTMEAYRGLPYGRHLPYRYPRRRYY